MKGFASLYFILVTLSVFAQKEKHVTAQYQVVLERNSTIAATEEYALQQAKLRAIADAYGTSISETTLLKTEDKNGKNSQDFQVLSNQNVKGEWVKDLGKPEIKWACNSEGNYECHVKIEGSIRPLNTSGKASISVATSSNPSRFDNQNLFKNNDDLYIQFSSSNSGFISVYYIDHASNTVMRLAPSLNANELNGLQVKADQPYVLLGTSSPFSEDKGFRQISLSLPDGKDNQIDELVVVFSPKEIAKPAMTKSDGFYITTIEAFEKWKSNIRSNNPDVIVHSSQITIQK